MSIDRILAMVGLQRIPKRSIASYNVNVGCDTDGLRAAVDRAAMQAKMAFYQH